MRLFLSPILHIDQMLLFGILDISNWISSEDSIGGNEGMGWDHRITSNNRVLPNHRSLANNSIIPNNNPIIDSAGN